MKNKSVIFLTLCLLLFVAACSNNNNESKIEHAGETPNLSGIVIIDGEAYDMIAGGFRWKAPDKEVLTDAASPDQVAEDFDVINVTSGEDIKIEIAENPNIKLQLWEEHAISEVESFDNQHFLAPDKPGQYIYEATAIWANSTSVEGWTRGEVSYTFVIEVN